MLLKRMMDVSLAALGLVLLSPLIAALAVAARTFIGSPVLFRQQRPGLYGRPFTMLKFRTMRPVEECPGTSASDSERMTPLGRILRDWSLDELPELWNVIRGDMSLVGPRPLLMEYVDLYTAEQKRRHQVRPGITGWAQVNGRNGIPWEEKFRLDVWYVDQRSLCLDVWILCLTAFRVLQRSDINQDGFATAEPFQGTTGCGRPDPLHLRSENDATDSHLRRGRLRSGGPRTDPGHQSPVVPMECQRVPL